MGKKNENGTKKQYKAMEKVIHENVTYDDIVLALAEEAAELSQAALKYVRSRIGTNPTSVLEEDALEHMKSEFEDVILNARLLGIRPDSSAYHYRIERWSNGITAWKNGEA